MQRSEYRPHVDGRPLDQELRKTLYRRDRKPSKMVMIPAKDRLEQFGHTNEKNVLQKATDVGT